jgi:hypothetical protein
MPKAYPLREEEIVTQPVDKGAGPVPRVVGVEATRKGGQACDFVVIAVPVGLEDAWLEAAKLWGYSLRASERGPGRIAVLVPRSNPYTAVNGQRVLDGIQQQRNLNRKPPEGVRKAPPRA